MLTEELRPLGVRQIAMQEAVEVFNYNGGDKGGAAAWQAAAAKAWEMAKMMSDAADEMLSYRQADVIKKMLMWDARSWEARARASTFAPDAWVAKAWNAKAKAASAEADACVVRWCPLTEEAKADIFGGAGAGVEGLGVCVCSRGLDSGEGSGKGCECMGEGGEGDGGGNGMDRSVGCVSRCVYSEEGSGEGGESR